MTDAAKQPTPPALLSRREAAHYLGVAEHTLAVWHCTKRYPLPVVQIGRLVKYQRSDLDAFIARNRIGAQPEVDRG